MSLTFFMIYTNICVILTTGTSDNEALRRLKCSLGELLDPSCPLDGGWGLWGAWGPCAGDCDAMGRRVRKRLCNNPAPKNDGTLCLGRDSEVEACQLVDCKIEDYQKLVDGDPLRMEKFKQLQQLHLKFPALVEKCFATDCSYNSIQPILKDFTSDYWNALHCVKHNVGCPVRGGWSSWKAWSACSAQCGKGTRHRSRLCDNPLPSEPRLQCIGEGFSTEECTGISCAHKQDGTWEQWMTWSACSVSCGRGFSTRRRICKDPAKSDSSKPKRAVDWGNRCAGPTEETKSCENDNCAVDGGWSDWEQWSPCSKKCGQGARSRNRMCSNPVASGSGKPCEGVVTEIEHCYERPCGARIHEVAVFNGEASLLFSPTGRSSRLLQVYLRFMTLSPFGTIIHRYEDNCPESTCDFLRISVQGGTLVLLAHISGCSLSIIRQEKVITGEWNELLVAVTGTEGTMRVNNGEPLIKGNLTCEPVMPNLDHAMLVGERFRGQIQQIAVNFSPVRLHREKGSDEHTRGSAPYSTSNVVYEMADNEEGFRPIGDKQLLRAPCPQNPDKWRVEMAIKPETNQGVIVCMTANGGDGLLMARLDNSRVKLRLHHGDFKSEVENGLDSLPGKWLHLVISKDTDSGDVWMRVNGNQKMIVVVTNSTTRDNAKQLYCEGDFFVGDVPDSVQDKLKLKMPIDYLTGTVGYLAIDGAAEDLETLPEVDQSEQRYSSQFSSLSENYEEIPVLLGQQLNLSCLYDKNVEKLNKRDSTGGKRIHNAYWIRLDVPVHEAERGGIFSISDDGRLSTLTVSSYTSRSSIEGFYSCWIPRRFSEKLQKNSNAGYILITFGVAVINGRLEFGAIPWRGWILVGCITSLSLALTTMWMAYEAYIDFTRGYGFFRDQKLTPKELIEKQLKFIDSKSVQFLLGSNVSRKMSKSKLHKKKKGLSNAFDADFSEDEPPLPPTPRNRKSLGK